MATPARPLVTIGIPTYNRADGNLSQALRSAIGQSYPNLEVVVSDNGSTDGTQALVAGFHSPRVRYFRQARTVKPNDNFNFCLQQARGEFFLLLHDDDLLDTDMIEACMDAVGDQSDVGIIRTGARTINEHGTIMRERRNEVAGLSAGELMLGWFADTTPVYFACSLFNTARLRETGGFYSKHLLFQDTVAVFKLAALYGRVDLPEVKAGFRQHTENMGSSVATAAWCDDSLYLLDVMCELAPEYQHELRRVGVPYFVRRNVKRANQLPIGGGRLRTYFMIYRRFDYHPELLKRVYRRLIGSRLRKHRAGQARA